VRSPELACTEPEQACAESGAGLCGVQSWLVRSGSWPVRSPELACASPELACMESGAGLCGVQSKLVRNPELECEESGTMKQISEE